MTAVTAEQVLRSREVDPDIIHMVDMARRQKEQRHVAEIVDRLGDQSGIPSIELPFAGGTFRFRLTELELALLELGYSHPRCRSGLRAPPMRVGEAYARLLRGRYQVESEDVGIPGAADFSVIEMTAVIRMALLGGGGGVVDGAAVTWRSEDVEGYMSRHVHTLTLMKRWDLCLAILGARVEGWSLPAPGDAEGAGTSARG